jgi:dihydroorotate dehydrogenase electron transfer subunit
MKQVLATVSSNEEVTPGIHLMWIEAPDIAAAAQPGQFITVRCGDFTLRRPFSIHQVGSSNVIASDLPAKAWQAGVKQSQFAILFRVAGKGTLWLSQRQEGERIDILGPLGKGFTVAPESKNLLLVAGGLGIAPLVSMAQQASPQHQVILLHGVSTAAQLYPFSLVDGNKRNRLAPLPNGVQFIPITEDGSMGKKGLATEILPHFLDWADQVHACGPVAMYKAIALSLNPSPLKGEKKGEGEKRSKLKPKKCQVSLEVRMGCGFGACYGCTINTKKGLKQVCRDGPVFELDDIIWQEVRI